MPDLKGGIFSNSAQDALSDLREHTNVGFLNHPEPGEDYKVGIVTMLGVTSGKITRFASSLI